MRGDHEVVHTQGGLYKKLKKGSTINKKSEQ